MMGSKKNDKFNDAEYRRFVKEKKLMVKKLPEVRKSASSFFLQLGITCTAAQEFTETLGQFTVDSFDLNRNTLSRLCKAQKATGNIGHDFAWTKQMTSPAREFLNVLPERIRDVENNISERRKSLIALHSLGVQLGKAKEKARKTRSKALKKGTFLTSSKKRQAAALKAKESLENCKQVYANLEKLVEESTHKLNQTVDRLQADQAIMLRKELNALATVQLSIAKETVDIMKNVLEKQDNELDVANVFLDRRPERRRLSIEMSVRNSSQLSDEGYEKKCSKDENLLQKNRKNDDENPQSAENNESTTNSQTDDFLTQSAENNESTTNSQTDDFLTRSSTTDGILIKKRVCNEMHPSDLLGGVNLVQTYQDKEDEINLVQTYQDKEDEILEEVNEFPQETTKQQKKEVNEFPQETIKQQKKTKQDSFSMANSKDLNINIYMSENDDSSPSFSKTAKKIF